MWKFSVLYTAYAGIAYLVLLSWQQYRAERASRPGSVAETRIVPPPPDLKIEPVASENVIRSVLCADPIDVPGAELIIDAAKGRKVELDELGDYLTQVKLVFGNPKNLQLRTSDPTMMGEYDKALQGYASRRNQELEIESELKAYRESRVPTPPIKQIQAYKQGYTQTPFYNRMWAQANRLRIEREWLTDLPETVTGMTTFGEIESASDGLYTKLKELSDLDTHCSRSGVSPEDGEWCHNQFGTWKPYRTLFELIRDGKKLTAASEFTRPALDRHLTKLMSDYALLWKATEVEKMPPAIQKVFRQHFQMVRLAFCQSFLRPDLKADDMVYFQFPGVRWKKIPITEVQIEWRDSDKPTPLTDYETLAKYADYPRERSGLPVVDGKDGKLAIFRFRYTGPEKYADVKSRGIKRTERYEAVFRYNETRAKLNGQENNPTRVATEWEVLKKDLEKQSNPTTLSGQSAITDEDKDALLRLELLATKLAEYPIDSKP